MLHRAYRELHDMGLKFTATHQSVETTRRRVSEGECWVAMVGKTVVGTIVWVRPNPLDDVFYYRRAEVAHFGQFGVDPLFRGLGIGTKLLNHVEALAKESGFRELALDTAESAKHLISLYERLGYKIVDNHDWRPGTNYLSVIMTKAIGK
ncbi:MAG TPA: GNAT family N-acetyltransferase [Fimbriimonadaceae bacterium]|nr:GNAT family N-acetyltransferase [Fimbriimonadaceae bacterium]